MAESRLSRRASAALSMQSISLKRRLDMWDAVSLLFSIIVGSGIFISPQGVLINTGSVGAACIIALCGIVALCGAISYAELGCRIPSAGGDYEYLLNGCGDLSGFLFNWTIVVLLIPSGGAIGALAFARYIIEPFFPCEIPEIPKRLLAIVAVLYFGAINCSNTRIVRSTQKIAAVGKTLALVLIIIAGIVGLFKGGGHHFEDAFANTEKDPMKFSIAFLSGFFSYSGWNCLNFVVEELKEPRKNLPRSICIGLISVIVFFVLVNASYMVVLSKEEIIASNAIASDVVAKIWWPLGHVMSILVSFSVFGFLNSFLFSSSRVTFDAARNRHMPSIYGSIHVSERTPVISIITSCVLIIIFVFLGEIPNLVTMSAFADNFWSMVVLFSFFHLRKTMRGDKDCLEVPLVFPITYIVSAVIVTGVSLYIDPKPCGGALVLILCGVPVYSLLVGFERIKRLGKSKDKAYRLIQILTNSAFPKEAGLLHQGKNRRQ